MVIKAFNTEPSTKTVLIRHGYCHCHYFDGITPVLARSIISAIATICAGLLSPPNSFIILHFWQERNFYIPVTFLKPQEGGCCSSYEMMNWESRTQLNSLKERSVAKPVTSYKSLSESILKTLGVDFALFSFLPPILLSFSFLISPLSLFLRMLSVDNQEHWIGLPVSYICSCLCHSKTLLNL